MLDHEQMPLRRQARHIQRVRCRDAPAERQRRDFVGRFLPFHREQAPIARQQMSAYPHEFRKTTERPRHKTVEAYRCIQGFGARLRHAQVRKAQMALRLTHETRLLAVGFDHGDIQVWQGQRERYAWQSSAGADVGQGAVHEREDRQRIQQVLGYHLGGVADRGQVVGAVPTHQQRQIVQQPRGQRFRRKAKRSQAGIEYGTEVIE